MEGSVYSAEIGLELTVALTLFALAATLLTSPRRTAAHWTLAAFLLAVGLNYAGIALAFWTGRLEWAQAAYVGLAVDPLLLLLFVVRHPYPRRPRGLGLTVAALVLAAVFTSFVALAAPDRLVAGFTKASTRAPARLVPLAAMTVSYGLSFSYAVAATARAPSLGLARRAAWTLAAVGIATVPRLGLLPTDVAVPGWQLFLGPGPWTAGQALVGTLVTLAINGSIIAAVLGVAYVAAARGPTPGARLVRGALAFVGLFAGCLLTLSLVLALWYRVVGSVPSFGQSLGYAPRWILFGVILVHGLLAHEVLEVRRGLDRVAPWVGGLVAGAGVVLIGAGITSLPLAITLGVAFVVPATYGARGFLRTLRALQGVPDSSRPRFELYRASLEHAWARGPPPQAVRRRLDAERARLGLSLDEALALEHVVSSSATPDAAPLAPGDEPVPGLVVETLLGEGSRGRVWRAVRLPAGGRVVVKEFRRDAFADGPSARDRIRREVDSLAGLRHPNIPRMLDAHFVAGRCLLIREDVDGWPLSQELRRGPLPSDEVERLARQLLDAFRVLHARGIVHRDLKPDNVLVNAGGHVWLTDFDVADTRRTTPEATATRFEAVGGFAGSLAYMAPEQARGRETGPSADLYALGLLLYEALTGRRALQLRGLDPFAALEAVVRPDIDWKRLPPRWRKILRRALDVSPARRYRNADAFAKALDAPLPRASEAGRRARGKARKR